MANKEKLRKNKKSKSKLGGLYTVLAIAIFSAVTTNSAAYLSQKNPTTEVSQKTNTPNKKIVYVRQYSDKNITENAKNADPKFKNITFSDKTSLLGNVISSIDKSTYTPSTSEENGTWLWTPILQMTPEYISQIITESKNKGIKNIYLSIDSYLDIFVIPESEEKEILTKKFDENIRYFIQSANNSGMTVDAEAGWRNWAETGNSYKAFATLNYAVNFNKKNTLKFRSFQYDVEPYLLDYYEDEKKAVLGNLVNLIDESVAWLDGSNLTLTVVVPEFFDETYKETPKIFYAGKTLSPAEQILRVLDKREGSKLIVMSYRNFSKGENGIIDITKNEIDTANKYNTKIIVAVETGDVEPPYITFYNTRKSHYQRQLGYMKDEFRDEKSYGGIATHFVNSFIELR